MSDLSASTIESTSTIVSESTLVPAPTITSTTANQRNLEVPSELTPSPITSSKTTTLISPSSSPESSKSLSSVYSEIP
nr:1925_t:CDS:2 [Entrophospora candida]